MMTWHSTLQKKTFTGFNLIEGSIVLAVVGMVIGGIWVTKNMLDQNARINEITQAILKIVTGVRYTFPVQNYPTTYAGDINITAAAYNAGIIPNNFKYFSTPSPIVVSQGGIGIRVRLACYGHCPGMIITIASPLLSSLSSASSTDCVQIIRRITGLFTTNDRSNLISTNLATASNSNYATYNSPTDPSTIRCPSDWQNINFWFTPAP